MTATGRPPTVTWTAGTSGAGHAAWRSLVEIRVISRMVGERTSSEQVPHRGQAQRAGVHLGAQLRAKDAGGEECACDAAG